MKKHIVVLAMILLLSSLPISTNASNLSLSNSIAVHSFDTLNGNNFVSHGVVIINNQDTEPVTIKLILVKELSSIDKNITTGEPRIHSVSDSIYFHEIPTTEWISFNDTYITIPPQTSSKINYTIDIPKEELPSFINKTNGFLCYIGIGETTPDNPGANIGVNYKFKVFITFPIIDKNPLTNPLFIFFLSVIVTILTYITILSIKKIRLHKKQLVDET